METTYWSIKIKEVGKDDILETEYLGNIDRDGLIEFYGLNNDDVEWYEIKELPFKPVCF